jgi:hypothetical protein
MFGFCSCRYQSSFWAYIPAISKTILPAIFLNLHSAKQVVSIMHIYIYFHGNNYKNSQSDLRIVYNNNSITSINPTINWNEPIILYTCIINQYFLSSIHQYFYHFVPLTKLFHNLSLYNYSHLQLSCCII